MEVYILDGLLRRKLVVDKFESLIWTERWNSYGDFELELNSSLENRNRFLVGTHLAINNSYRVMTVETVEDDTDEDGKNVLKVGGRSLEAMLEDRVVKESIFDLEADPEWVITGLPKAVAETMFDHICRVPTALDPGDAIPFLMPGSIFPEGTIPELETPIEWKQRPDSLYNAIRSVCSLYDLGFRIVRNFDTSQLYFDVYTGNDRTTRQADLLPVIFSAELDNLQNTTELSTIQKSKNVAYVFSDVGHAIVYGEDIDPDIEGFDRRVLVVNANVDENHPNINAALVQQGLEALQKNRAMSMFDGELNQRSEYVYGVHYDLGDLVEMRNRDGVITYRRVSEQIFVSDANGDRSYPTVAIDLFASANTWLSWTNDNTVWEDFTTEHWADM